MKEKAKTRLMPPDVRLAQAFHFTAQDLAVNRGGYMTRRQQGLLDVIVQYVIDLAFHLLPGREGTSANRGFRKVKSICGRIQLRQFLPDHRYRTFRGEKYTTFHQLTFEGRDDRFPLTEEQFAVLVDNVTYRVYFDAFSTGNILSLERVNGRCDSPDELV